MISAALSFVTFMVSKGDGLLHLLALQEFQRLPQAFRAWRGVEEGRGQLAVGTQVTPSAGSASMPMNFISFSRPTSLAAR